MTESYAIIKMRANLLSERRASASPLADVVLVLLRQIGQKVLAERLFLVGGMRHQGIDVLPPVALTWT